MLFNFSCCLTLFLRQEGKAESRYCISTAVVTNSSLFSIRFRLLLLVQNRGRQTAAREHVFLMKGMRSAKKKIGACEHINMARKAKICFNLVFFFGLLVLFDQFRLMSLKNILKYFTSLAIKCENTDQHFTSVFIIFIITFFLQQQVIT